ncbi:MYG1 family protein [Coraliomargarita parva]|uniref:MYG1 family protein n=1 Tax=Coraliomargarita parva TaxID=3014050 RepID=UPI0022B4486A|nr:MYG1 family protein [Coraliomargarita parva]
MLTTIVTHPGGAHKDDFLACCVLLAKDPVRIERRDPTEADLSDPKVAVVDIGDQHDASLMNFDHHQFPRDHAPTCALSLVLQRLGLYEDAKSFCDWLETSEWLDCRGPVDTAKWLGTERDVLSKLNSPVDVTLLRRFASKPVHQSGEPVWEVMRMVGQDLLEYITSLRERLDYIKGHAEIWELEGFKALFMPRTDPMPDEPSAGLGRYIEQLGLENEVLAMVYPDRRGEGYGMRRYNDDPRMEFTRIDSEDDVHFTHARGFIAKTSSSGIERLKALLQKAFVQA